MTRNKRAKQAARAYSREQGVSYAAARRATRGIGGDVGGPGARSLSLSCSPAPGLPAFGRLEHLERMPGDPAEGPAAEELFLYAWSNRDPAKALEELLRKWARGQWPSEEDLPPEVLAAPLTELYHRADGIRRGREMGFALGTLDHHRWRFGGQPAGYRSSIGVSHVAYVWDDQVDVDRVRPDASEYVPARPDLPKIDVVASVADLHGERFLGSTLVHLVETTEEPESWVYEPRLERRTALLAFAADISSPEKALEGVAADLLHPPPSGDPETPVELTPWELCLYLDPARAAAAGVVVVASSKRSALWECDEPLWSITETSGDGPF